MATTRASVRNRSSPLDSLSMERHSRATKRRTTLLSKYVSGSREEAQWKKRGTRHEIEEEGYKKRRGPARGVHVVEEEAPRGLTTLGRSGLMIEERSRLNDPCPRVLDSPWIGPRFAVESKRAPSLPTAKDRRPWESAGRFCRDGSA